MTSSGTGRSVREICPWLADPTQRHNMILNVVERDSVIEGLPPFSEDFREELLQQLRRLSGEVTSAPSEVIELPVSPSAHNPS